MEGSNVLLGDSVSSTEAATCCVAFISHAATLKPRASVDHEVKAKTFVQTLTQDAKKYQSQRYQAEKKARAQRYQAEKKARAEARAEKKKAYFAKPRSDRTVVEAASYEATKGTDEQAVLLQDREWSTLKGATLAQAVKDEKFAMYLFATSRDMKSEYYTNLTSDNSMLKHYDSGKSLKKTELDKLNPRYELLCWTKVWMETRKLESALQTSIHHAKPGIRLHKKTDAGPKIDRWEGQPNYQAKVCLLVLDIESIGEDHIWVAGYKLRLNP
ncbi:hypothetical protein PPROV_000229800 [Pycnococcus provasolii]|uniref:Uncharacterized protein n=1 Tax=Pycnococcus provasolii TaxID=41880 RepID=A0A830HAQ8_9CHLO|nr:hypothetical protein PPROV_000229800 [Pycnococcus provasolii]